MASIKTNKRWYLSVKLTIVFTILIFGFSRVDAQSVVTIAEIQVGGQYAQQANITVTLPKGTPKQTTIQVNSQFASGTIFEIPANTVVTITSNNNRQRLGPGSKHQASPSSKGESHTTFWGTVTHMVSNKLNFYKASGSNEKVQGAVQSTVFTVESVGKDVKFKTIEGSVQMQQKVKVDIAEQSQVQRKQERDLETVQTSWLNAGAPEQTYAYNNNAEVEYATYAEAVDAFTRQLNQAYESGADAEYLADEYTLVGELYMEMGEAYNAIDPFSRSLSLYYNEIDPYDPLIAMNYLNLAEAYLLAGYEQEGSENWKTAMDIIIDDLNYNLELYNYLVDYTEDDEMIWSIGMDIVDNYFYLGWGYDVLGNYDKADYYYNLSDNLEYDLSQY
jgi:hypothetical protein